jgi:hypothetical protein
LIAIGVVEQLTFRASKCDEVADSLVWPTRLWSTLFEELLEWLLVHTDLTETERSIISAAEKLIIFLIIVAYGLSFHVAEEIFQHSTATISAIFYEVLKGMLTLHCAVILPALNETPEEIAEDPKHCFFADCIGALDGCHIPICIPPTEYGQWRNQKQVVTQNMLAVCNFKMNFLYILAGWEGSAHDGRVATSVRVKSFKAPAGKYFLADAAYRLDEMTITPYPRIRYHLQEYARVNQQPQTKEELFNLRYASLRNTIEHCFAVLKRQFCILDRGWEGYSRKM